MGETGVAGLAPWPDLMAALSDVVVARVRQVWQVLGLAEPLRSGPQSVAELAEYAGVDASSLHRMLRLLACVGDLDEPEPGVFALTSGSRHRPSLPFGPAAEGIPASGGLQAATRIRDEMPAIAGPVAEVFSVRGFIFSLFTGKPAFNEFVGTDGFTYFGQETGTASELHTFTASATVQTAPAVISTYDFSSCRVVIDVGGSSGALIFAVLRAYPGAEGIVFDSPSGCEQARQRLGEAADLAGRWRVIPGDFFDGVPGLGDIYLLKSVLHDWSDDRAVTILRNCRRAMPPGARLLVIEPVLAATAQRTAPYLKAVLSDLICLLMTEGGHERTEAAFGDLLGTAGFQVTSVAPAAAPSHFHLIEAVPA